MTANLRSLLYTLAKLLALPWLLVTHQLSSRPSVVRVAAMQEGETDDF